MIQCTALWRDAPPILRAYLRDNGDRKDNQDWRNVSFVPAEVNRYLICGIGLIPIAAHGIGKVQIQASSAANFLAGLALRVTMVGRSDVMGLINYSSRQAYSTFRSLG